MYCRIKSDVKLLLTGTLHWYWHWYCWYWSWLLRAMEPARDEDVAVACCWSSQEDFDADTAAPACVGSFYSHCCTARLTPMKTQLLIWARKISNPTRLAPVRRSGVIIPNWYELVCYGKLLDPKKQIIFLLLFIYRVFFFTCTPLKC